MSSNRVIIGGASMAGQSAAVELRKGGYGGGVLLIGAEDVLPYDRPPLSKSVLTGEWDLEKIILKDADFYADQEIELKLGTRVTRIDAVNQNVLTDAGEAIEYTSLVLATGGIPRQLPVPGADLNGVHHVGQYAAALCVGRPKDFRAAKLLLSNRSPIDRELFSDVNVDIFKYAKAAAK